MYFEKEHLMLLCFLLEKQEGGVLFSHFLVKNYEFIWSSGKPDGLSPKMVPAEYSF